MHERMHTSKKTHEKSGKFEKSRNLKIENIADVYHIPISLHAKFQGNRAIHLGEKRGRTDGVKSRLPKFHIFSLQWAYFYVVFC